MSGTLNAALLEQVYLHLRTTPNLWTLDTPKFKVETLIFNPETVPGKYICLLTCCGTHLMSGTIMRYWLNRLMEVLTSLTWGWRRVWGLGRVEGGV